jgi:hypothetical protein
VGQAFVGMEFVGMPPAVQLLGQLDALREGHQLITHAVEETDRWEAVQMIEAGVLVG